MNEPYFSHSMGHQESKVWGSWEILSQSMPQDALWQVKTIRLKAEQSLSLQKHQFREEYWVVLAGIGRFTINDNVWKGDAGSIYHVPQTAPHRIENVGTEELVILEVQMGHLIREDDLERLEDTYGRNLGNVDPASDIDPVQDIQCEPRTNNEDEDFQGVA